MSAADLALPFLLALVPITWLVFALIALRWPAWKAAIGSLAAACVLGGTHWALPVPLIASAAAEGFVMALWPIVLVIVAAVFTYNLCVHTGAMDVIGRMVTSLSCDRRVLALLVAWCFGGFMEGMSGFGTAIAIPAGMLAALGFPPLQAVLICLVANGVPTCFGSVGVPTTSLADLVGLDVGRLAFTEMVQLTPFFLIAPFLVVLIAGEGPGTNGPVPTARPSVAERLRGMVPLAFVAGVAFVLPSLAVAAFVGPELTLVVGSLCSLAATALLARRSPEPPTRFKMQVAVGEPITARGALRSWSCFILVFALLLVTSKLVAPVNAFFAQFSSQVQVYVGPDPATVSFSWVNTPGVWIFLAAFAGGTIQSCSVREMLGVLTATVKQMLPTTVTMLSVLGCAKVMGYTGMIGSISAFCIAVTGALFPLVAPVIGAVGSFVTGSGTSAGLLFGTVQLQAATALGMDSYWIVALNSLGVAAGKMISPQSLAIGMAAARVVGKDAELLRRALPYAVAFLVLMAVFAFAGAAVL